MADIWYNSPLASNVGKGVTYALIFGTLILGGGSCYRNNILTEAARIRRGNPIIHRADLNRDGQPEEFCEIGKKRFFSEIDGKNLEATFNK